MNKYHILVEENVLQTELKEHCSEKNIKLLTTNGSPIDILTLFALHRPLVIIVNEKDTIYEICESLIQAKMEPRFIMVTENVNRIPKQRGIEFLKKGDIFGLKSIIGKLLLEKISSDIKFKEEFELFADRYIYETLARLGFRLKNSGTVYLHDVLDLMFRGEYDSTASVTKEIYPLIAKRYNTTPAAIERNIRTAIGHYWNSEKIIHHLGEISLPLTENNIIPGNKETIHYISNKIFSELKRKRAEMQRRILENA